MYAIALRQNEMWIDFQFVDSELSANPLETAMRHVYPQFRDQVQPVILATYTDNEFNALMEGPLYSDFIELYNSDAMVQIGTGIGFNDFVNRWFHICKLCGNLFKDDGFDTCEGCDHV